MAIKFKNIIDTPCGLRFIFSKLNLSSTLSRTLVLESEIITSDKEIETAYDELKQIDRIFSKGGDLYHLKHKIKLKLSHLKDIRRTLKKLNEGFVLDDIELYEIKHLAIISEDIKELEGELIPDFVKLPDLKSVISILDPEDKKIGSFYIYDKYSEELKIARDHLKCTGVPTPEIMNLISSIEDEVRKNICIELKKSAKVLNDSLSGLSKTDILIAKSEQISELKLSIPSLSQSETKYRALFNPEVSEILRLNKREFQPVDICFKAGRPLLITGSNMGGKSVTLKTLALSQYLFQFCFGIPAKEASVPIVDNISYCSGDEQDYKKGLSTFAAELKRIDTTLKLSRSGIKVLALIDEPAGTTNPKEGTALAAGLIRILEKTTRFSVVTTHYNLDNVTCQKLKVTGLVNGKMDYSLSELDGGVVPYEALKIAESLHIDSDWLDETKKELDKLNL